MTPPVDAQFEELNRDFRRTLRASIEDGHSLADLAEAGEALGALCTAADLDALRDATSVAQVFASQLAAQPAQELLTLVREALAAAILVRSTERSEHHERAADASVRDQVLSALSPAAPRRPAEIATELSVGLPQVSRALRELADSGHVVTTEVPGADGRARFWVLSRGASLKTAPYRPALGSLQLPAVDTGQFRNDMLPLGPSDRVEIDALRPFIDQLKSSVAEGRYRPSAAELFRVAKGADTTRPAALMRLPDRVIYTALTNQLAETIESTLSSSALWPRGHHSSSRWDEFEELPMLATGASHVVVADVSSFYDSIDHEVLGDALRTMGAENECISPLLSLLGAVMQRPVGLPQGLPASDPLASAALTSVDAQLERSGLQFGRHGDDFRIAVTDRHEARKAIAVLDEALRSHRLHLNTAKTHTVTIEDYETNLERRSEQTSGVFRELRRVMGFETDQGLVGSSEGFDPESDPSLDLVGRLAGIEGARGFRQSFSPSLHVGSRTVTGRYGEIEDFEFAEPDPEEVAAYTAFESLMDTAESAVLEAVERLRGHQDRWKENFDRHNLSSMLSLLAAGGRPAGDAQLWLDFLLARPQDTRPVATYFAHLADAEEVEIPYTAIHLAAATPLSDWQRAWLFSALGWAGSDAIAGVKQELFTHLEERSGWLTRLAAASLLQQAALLSGSQLSRLWAGAPLALRSDLVVLLSRSEQTRDIERALRDDLDDVERGLVAATA